MMFDETFLEYITGRKNDIIGENEFEQALYVEKQLYEYTMLRLEKDDCGCKYKTGEKPCVNCQTS